MVDLVAIGSLLTAVGAIVFAALTWLESRKQRQLLETFTKALPFLARTRRRPPTKGSGGSAALQAAAEERRRLKLELEREKLQWRQNRDIAKAIGWFADRISIDEGNNAEDNE